jgi:hypothetical protein
MLDLYAPIVPGKATGGIRLNQDIQEILDAEGEVFVLAASKTIHGNPEYTVYRSESIDLWVHGNAITQIAVHGNYKGKLLEAIGVGTPLDEVVKLVGPLVLDDEDNVVPEKIGGICFEYDVSSKQSPITDIFIFSSAK